MEKVLSEYLMKHHPAKILFEKLGELGDIYLIGGVLREIKDNGKVLFLRDIDIVLDTEKENEYEILMSEYKPEKNKFGGYKIQCQDLIVDIWLLRQTWAYSAHVIKCDKKDYPTRLPETVFLNMDSIVYDMKNSKWYDDKYREAMETKVLDVVLQENPFLELNIVRSFVIKKKYEMIFSDRLKELIRNYFDNCSKRENDVILRLCETQKIRYKKEILSKAEFEETLKEIIYQ